MPSGPRDTSNASEENAAAEAAAIQSTAVIGAGSIGAAFALVFASAGRDVAVYDTQASSLEGARVYIEKSLGALRENGLLDDDPGVIMQRLHFCSDLSEALSDATWVHECAPERLELKQGLFKTLDQLARPDAILASATSALPASQFAEGLEGQHRCLVAHPGNPPFLLRVLELVPAPFTDGNTVARARHFAQSIDLDPILVCREVEGFVFNRLQGAMLREAYCLVRDGVASVEDIDTLVRKGLGLRWSVIGPFETVDLNTRGGIASHAEKLGPAYARMGAERGQHDPWTEELVSEVNHQRRTLLPLENWSERVAWRDRALMRRLADGAGKEPTTD